MLSQILATSGLRITQCPVFTASASVASETTPWEIYTGKYRFNNPIPNRVNSWVFIIARAHIWDIPKHKIIVRGAFIFKWNDASSPICLLILAGVHPNDVVMRLQLKTVAISSAKTNGMGSGCWGWKTFKEWNVVKQKVGSGLRTCCN